MARRRRRCARAEGSEFDKRGDLRCGRLHRQARRWPACINGFWARGFCRGLHAGGAVALRWMGDRFEQTVALPPKYDRPWGRGSISELVRSQPLASAGDATPRPENLETED